MLEKLIKSIMAEAEADGEPVTYDEAKEMAEMEIKAKGVKRYEQTAPTKKDRKPKERKIDEEKGYLLSCIRGLLGGEGAEIIATKTETEVEFNYNGNHYSVKLTKHRPPKK